MFYSIFSTQTDQCLLDCALTLEGQAEDELPEELLAVCRVDRYGLLLWTLFVGRGLPLPNDLVHMCVCVCVQP
jgi:hypothetical protein